MQKFGLKQSKIATIAVLLLSATVVSTYGQEAKQLYEQTCAVCHGTEGKGDGPTSKVLQPKPADLTTVLKGKDDAYLSKVIREGGASVGKSPLMPSYQDVFNKEQIQELIQYVRKLIAS